MACPTVRRLASLLLLVACAEAGGPPPPAGSTGGGNAAPAASSRDALRSCEKSTSLQVLSHDIELEVSIDPPSLTGKGSVRVKATEPTSLVALDARELVVSRVLVGSEPVRFERTPALVCVELKEPLAAGGEQTLWLEWRVSAGRRQPRFSKHDVWGGYQTPAWMPTLFDAAQRATLVLHVSADAALEVGASGRAGQRRPLADGRTQHAFVLERPSPPFLYAFAVGRFDAAELRVDDVLLRAFGPAGADLTGVLHATGEMYRFVRGKLGVPLPWGEYLQMFVQGEVAQEAAGLALIGAQALSDWRANPQADRVFMHELAHQWFGWLLPCADFADFWLNEGFATFMVGAFKEARWGAAAHAEELANWRRRSADARKHGRDGPIALSSATGASRAAPAESELQARGVTYSRGALVLHRLRTELGEEAFWQGVRTYLARHVGRGARTLDLRRSLEAASGHDLAAFFEQWVYTTAAEP